MGTAFHSVNQLPDLFFNLRQTAPTEVELNFRYDGVLFPKYWGVSKQVRLMGLSNFNAKSDSSAEPLLKADFSPILFNKVRPFGKFLHRFVHFRMSILRVAEKLSALMV